MLEKPPRLMVRSYMNLIRQHVVVRVAVHHCPSEARIATCVRASRTAPSPHRPLLRLVDDGKHVLAHPKLLEVAEGGVEHVVERARLRVVPAGAPSQS